MKNDGDRDEMLVQINMNKCLIVKEKRSTMTHNALITRKGKSKKGLLEYIYLRNYEFGSLFFTSNIIFRHMYLQYSIDKIKNMTK